MPVEPKKYLSDIEGLCAVFSRETLNGRNYGQIYRRLLDGQDYRFNQMMSRGGIFCELGHPVQESADFERTETDLNKVCAILTELTEGPDSRVYAKGKVLDTPAGRIFEALKPFYKFGFSSRGSYDAVDDYRAEGPDGWNQDTYVFKGFDLVAIPATEESIVSATESLNNKKTKSARESLDINEIANAANVSPEEINRELDKIFTDNGDIEGSEVVTMREYTDDLNKEKNEIVNDFALDKAVADLEEKGIGPDDITDTQTLETPASDIKQDLQTALGEAARLREDLERADFDKQNLQSQVDSLKSENEELLHRAVEAEKALKDYEEIKMLSQRLVDNYHGVKNEFDAQKKELEDAYANEQATATKWENEATAAANEKRLAQESLNESKKEASQYKSKAILLNKELVAAKESIIEILSTNYGVAKESVLDKLGKSYSVSQIKPAIESLANDAIRLSGIESYPTANILEENVKETIQYNDEIEKELFEGLNY